MASGKKRLPVTRNPLITSWQWHASLFSILSEDDNAKKWIYSNYIQLRCYNVEEIFTGEDILFTDIMPGNSSLTECPYLIASLMTKEQIESYCGDIVDFIIKSLDLGGYVYVVIDEAKILSDMDIGYKFPHELFIYGYDIDGEGFYVGDFTFKDKYAHNKISFEDVRKGYEVITAAEDHMFKHDYKGTRGLYVLFKNTDTMYYDVDITLIRDTLREYLNSQDTKNHFRMMRNRFHDTTFGVEVYDKVYDRIMKQVEREDYDIRALHVLYDHKVLMLDRIKYLMANEYLNYDQEIIDSYGEVVANMLAARNLLIKISINGNSEEASRFKQHFNTAKEKEVAILLEILSRLDQRAK